MSLLLQHAQQRLRAFLSEIDRALESEFPYPDSRNALLRIRSLSNEQLGRLDSFVPESDPNVVAQECRIALALLFWYLPFIGIIRRSTEIRNSFEAFGPFLRLAGDVLEPDTSPNERKIELVLSSEWDYSPFMYDRVQNLEDFLFIGLPASESGNPLLLPLAGHELGHAVWHREDLRKALQAEVQAAIIDSIGKNWAEYQEKFAIKIPREQLSTDIFAVASWRLGVEWCLDQAEETFCDFIGLAIFGECYFHAFGYILAPGLGRRSVRYPETLARVQHLVDASTQLGSQAPNDFISLFEKDPIAALSPADGFLLKMADLALETIIPRLVTAAKTAVGRASISRSAGEVLVIRGRFDLLAPAENCSSIANILNAGWDAFNDPGLWSGYQNTAGRKAEVLKELILKNLEIYEIEQIQAQ
ncbi:MAG TPA: hypothetical protein VMB20_11205 [Candidatus Acidoferrum sp.]|nr:hypothetical protein [Candidatus Acidoferrum sp.]